MKIYGDQAAIVVFNNQDSVPLAGAGFPRLRKMLEDQTTLVLPQDFLDVHPDYIINETQVLTLQGPWSERDAQMTETFERLEDVYGKGRVLGILGNSVSQPSSDYEEWRRAKREDVDEEAEDEKPSKVQAKSAVFNASSGPPGQLALISLSGWPRVQWADGSETVLDQPIGEQTIKATKLYTIMVVKFADGGNTRDKITLEFSFKQSSGWWTAMGVELKRGREAGVSLQAPQPPNAAQAVLGKAYHCSRPLVYVGDDAMLILPDVTMQAFMDSTDEFADAFDCVGFTTVPIWSGLMVTSIMLLGLAISTIMILDIRTMDKFENRNSKQLTITVSE